MIIDEAKRIIIKIGSFLIIDERGHINETWLKTLVEDVADLKKRGKEVIIVSSGAVALGSKYIKSGRNLKLEEKQAAAACGQVELVRYYQRFFNEKNLNAAQILLTLFDSENRRNYLNAKNTLETLLESNIVPIINENDTVATQELRFGDNDRLAARVAQMTSADLCILFSDVDGLYTSNPKLNVNAKHLDVVDDITDDIEKMGTGPLSSGVGSGGMITKISAAKLATSSGCSLILTVGDKKHPISTLEKGGKHTLFKATQTPMNARKQWIASSFKVTGEIFIDKGAATAIKQGNSLLPAGVIDVVGDFSRGDNVAIKDSKMQKIGVGISAYSSKDARLIMGHNSKDFENIIGFTGREELIHRDNMALEKEK